MTTQEVALGIYRIESVLGPRPFAQYLLRDERSLLVDTGIVSTPDEVILPALRELGLDPAELDYVLNTHADVDHFGGNAAIRAAAPRAIFCAHARGLPLDWRSRSDYARALWLVRRAWPDADYDAETKDWLRNAMGADVPVDLHLVGGEVFRLGPHLTVEVLHLPGHSPGACRALGSRLEDRNRHRRRAWRRAAEQGWRGHPPPALYSSHEYEATVRRFQALKPERFLTAHYAVMEGDDVDRFLRRPLAFVDRARVGDRARWIESDEVTIAGLLAALNPMLGPFTSMANELRSPSAPICTSW